MRSRALSSRTDGGAPRDESSLGYSSAALYTISDLSVGTIRFLLLAPALRRCVAEGDIGRLIDLFLRPRQPFPRCTPRRVASRRDQVARICLGNLVFSARINVTAHDENARTWGRDGREKKKSGSARRTALAKARPRCISPARSDTPRPRSGDSDCVSLNRYGIHSEWASLS